MMKNNYVQPLMAIVKINQMRLICASEDITSDVGIGYGGVDRDGTKHVDSRRHSGVYDDEEEQEEEW